MLGIRQQTNLTDIRTRGMLAVEVTKNKETTEDNDNICDRDKHRGHGGMETLAKNCDEGRRLYALLMCACLADMFR
jgi:hypothetical protein